MTKFALFVSLICFLMSFSARAETAVWQDLIVHDCNRGLHFFPSSPVGWSLDASPVMTVLDTIVREVKQRIGCTNSAKATKSNALCRYIPSLEMALYNFGQRYNKTDHQDMTDQYDGFPRYGFFDNSFPVVRDLQALGAALLGGIVPSGSKVDVEGVIPSTCDPVRFLKGQPCNVEVDMFEALGVKIGISVQQCPKKNAYAPYFSVSCQGGNCNKIFLPCLSDSECGSEAKCMDLWKDLFRVEDNPIDKSESCCLKSRYKYQDGNYNEEDVERQDSLDDEQKCLNDNKDCPSCDIRDDRKPKDNPEDGNTYEETTWTTGYGCYGGRSSVIAEDILYFLKDTGIIAEAEVDQLLAISKDKCSVDTNSDNLSFAWRFMYKIQSFIRKTVFKNDAPFQPQSDGEFKFCMPNRVAANKTKWGEEFAKLYINDKFDIDSDDLYKHYETCKSTSASKCGFYDVGNMICNEGCNIKECHWDGGDCDMPDGRKIPEITIDTDKQTYKAFVLDVSRESICKYYEETKDDKTTWKESCTSVDDSEDSPLELQDKDLDSFYEETFRTAHRKCSMEYGRYDMTDDDVDKATKCCIGSSSRDHGDVWWSKTKNKNITCPFMNNKIFEFDTGDCTGRPNGDEANCRDPYGYCKCMSVGLFRREGNFFTSSTMKKSIYVNIDRYDGNGICEQFTAYVCQLPYCDPNDATWDTKTNTDAKDTRGWAGGKGLTPPIRNNEGLDDKNPNKPVAYAGYWRQISEKDLGSTDCNGAGSVATKEPFPGYPPFNGDGTGFYELAMEGGDWEPGEIKEHHIITRGPSFIKPWDGELDDGTIANDALKMAGLVYKRPAQTTLFKDAKGRTMMRMDCDGTMGFGLGSGLELLGRWSFLHPLTTFIDDEIRYVQQCRHQLHGLPFNEDVYRVNWQIWHPESILYKVSQSGNDGKRPSIAGVETMIDKSGHEPYNLKNFGSPKQFQASAFKDGTDLPKELCTESCRLQSDFRIQMPDTCTYGLYKDKGLCKIKFSGLAEFFGVDNFDILGEFRRCSDPNAGGLFAGAMVMTGPVATVASPLQWCTSMDDCKNGNVCMDLTQKINVLKDIYGNLPRKVKTKVYDSDATIMSDRILEDPLAAFVYGQKQAKPSCVKKDGTFIAARQVLRALAQEVDDGKSDLKFCIPSFFEKLADGGDVGDDLKKFLTNRLSVQNNGVKVRDFSDNVEATYIYGINKLTIAGGKASLAADKGKVWQAIEVDIGGGSADVTCKQTEQARTAFMRQMKETDENSFKDLSQNDVVVKCSAKTTTTTKQAATGKTWQSLSVDIGRGSMDVTCKQTDKAREALLKQMKASDTLFSGLSAEEVHVSCTETTEKRVAQTLEFSGLTKDNVESSKADIKKDIADSLAVSETKVSITSIEEVGARRRRLLVSKTIVIDYDVEVADASAASSLESKMTDASVKNVVISKVATSTGVSEAIITVTQESPTTKAAGVKLDVAVQVNENAVADAKAKLETALNDKAGVAEKLADEGVETEKNSVIEVANIENIASAASTTKSIEATETAAVMEVQVQVEESAVQATKEKLKTSFNDKTKLAEKLGEAGVVKEDGSAISNDDIKDTKVADTVTKEVGISVADVPDNIKNIFEEESKGGFAAYTSNIDFETSPSPTDDEFDDDMLDTGHANIHYDLRLTLTFMVLMIIADM